MILIEDAERLGRESLASGQTIEQLLTTWRGLDLSILHSIQCLAHVTGMSLLESKKAVHCSRAWSDLRPQNDRFHEELENGIDLE
jgi:hypothetical protein